MAFRQNTVTVNPSAVHPKSPNSQSPANADAVVKGKPRMETPRSEMAMLSSSMLFRVDRSFLLVIKTTATRPLPVVDTMPDKQKVNIHFTKNYSKSENVNVRQKVRVHKHMIIS